MSAPRSFNLVAPALLLALVVLAFSAPLALLGLRGFEALEQRDVAKDLDRVTSALETEVRRLDSLGEVWSSWDDLYAYVAVRNAGFEFANLRRGAFIANDLDLVSIFDTDGQLAWGGVLGGQSEGLNGQPYAPVPMRDMADGEWLATALAQGEPARGVFETPRGPLLVSARPILTSTNEGPARGLLVVGRLLDSDDINALARQVQLPVDVLPLDGEGAADGTVITRSDSVYQATAIVRDPLGRPAFRIRTAGSGEVLATASDLAGNAALLLLVFLWLLVAGAAVASVRYAMFAVRRAMLPDAVAQLPAQDDPENHAADNDQHQRAASVLRDELQIAVRTARASTLVGVALCICLAAYLVTRVPASEVWPWLVVAVAGMCLRYLQLRWMGPRLDDARASTGRMRRAFSLGVLLTTVPLSLGLIWFTQWTDSTAETVIAIVLVSTVGGASATYATMSGSYLLYALVMLMPPLWFVWLGVSAGNLDRSMIGIMLIGSYGLLYMVHRFFYASHRDLLHLRQQHESLLLELEHSNLELASQRNAFEAASLTDALTTLANRRQFDATLDADWSRGARHGTPISCALLDIDHFKAYNDHYGHEAGDRCLQQIADVLSTAVRRKADLLARYGGEEFVLVMPETREVAAIAQAERFREAVHAANIEHNASPDSDRVTVSVGVATRLPEPDVGPGELVRLADEALYASKRDGRNRVTAAESRVITSFGDDPIRTLA